MPPSYLSSTSRALYRVFIAPNFAPSPTTALLPILFRRFKTYKKDTARHAITDYYTLDTAIRSPYINLVQPSIDPSAPTTLARSVRLSEVLASIDRSKEYLLQVVPGSYDEFGRPDMQNLPVCKTITKMELRSQLQKRLEIERRQAMGKAVGPTTKTLEINWAIAGGDLKHRMLKLQEFLGEGRKVELTIGPKRKGRVATEKECGDLLGTVRRAVEEVGGAKETKPPEGKIGGVMLLVFEGSREARERKLRER
ncbi:hypothetical protein P154DRAFT_465238, partial [Amniculicola lignicola CBS 123094]